MTKNCGLCLFKSRILILFSAVLCGLIIWKNQYKIELKARTTKNPIPYLRENGGCKISWDGSFTGCSYKSTELFLRKNEHMLSFLRPGKLEHTFCFDYHTIGNRIGDLFNSIGCAKIAGLHLVVTGSQYPGIKYLSALPKAIIHAAPILDKQRAVNIVKNSCQTCKIWCWENSNASWIHALPSVRSFMYKAALAHIEDYTQTTINKSIDLQISYPTVNNTSLLKHLPAIPDVTVQYRCDSVDRDHESHGFIPFHAIAEVIPDTSKHVYILTDIPGESIVSTRCTYILESLHVFLSTKFPRTTVVTKRS
mmetsp:Transcript_22761/g.21996  ORF Transcript_22761/g.21996 Transcript_22761/m.21996 type:complete len:308 (-) Transcript_22761:233-1156(-)